MAKQNKKETLPSDVIVVEVEELVAPEAAAGTEIILAETTVRQIARQLAASYAGFSIDNLTTAEAVEEAKRDHGQLVKFRNALDKRRLAVNRTTNEFAKEIQALFSPIETTIKTALDAYKEREDDRIAEEKRKLDELKKTREAALYALKAYWNGSQWQLGAVFASEADLVSDEVAWLPVLAKFDAERKRIDEEERVKEMRLLVSERKVVLMEMGAVGRVEQYQKAQSEWFKREELTPASQEPLLPPMVTLQIAGGRKEKIRPGDVLGALTNAEGGVAFAREQVGKIQVTDFCTFVGIARSLAQQACDKLNAGRVKGKSVRARLL
mgnify:CR=1 FL=1